MAPCRRRGGADGCTGGRGGLQALYFSIGQRDKPTFLSYQGTLSLSSAPPRAWPSNGEATKDVPDRESYWRQREDLPSARPRLCSSACHSTVAASSSPPSCQQRFIEGALDTRDFLNPKPTTAVEKEPILQLKHNHSECHLSVCVCGTVQGV